MAPEQFVDVGMKKDRQTVWTCGGGIHFPFFYCSNLIYIYKSNYITTCSSVGSIGRLLTNMLYYYMLYCTDIISCNVAVTRWNFVSSSSVV
jgi:hypothetical protein